MSASNAAEKLTLRQIASSRPLISGLAAIALVSIAVAAVLLTGGSPSSEEGLQKTVMPVRVEMARAVDRTDYKRILVGEVKAKRRSDLSFERSARIKKIHVEDGQSVKQGQPLAELDIEDLKIEQRRAKAALKNAQAVQAELKQGARAEVKASALAEVKALQAEMELASVIRNKRKDLVATNSISDEEYRQAELTLKAAEERLASANSKYVELINGTRQEKIDAQDALVEQLAAQCDAIQLDITKSTIKAPFDGAISRRYLDEGSIVSSGVPVLQISENKCLEAVVGVPSNSLGQIQVGVELKIKTEKPVKDVDQPKAKVIRILPESDSRTRLIPVVVELDSNSFKPGEIVRVELNEVRQLKSDGIRVRTVSLVPLAKGLSAVYVVKEVDGKLLAKLVPVTPLYNDGEYTLIKGPLDEGDQVAIGIQEGDRIISGGVHRITNGQVVSLLGSESPE